MKPKSAKASVPKKIRTLKEAHRFVMAVGICAIFTDRSGRLASLWDITDLPEKKPGQKGWGEKIGAVWSWKNRLPADYPDEIFYGKIPGGRAVLMTLDYLRAVHYPKHHKPIQSCSANAQRLFELVRVEPRGTTELRNLFAGQNRLLRAAFARALVELQVTLNVVRLNASEVEADTWVPFQEQYGWGDVSLDQPYCTS